MDAADRTHNQTFDQAHPGMRQAGDGSAAGDAVNLADLEPLTTLLVRTANTVYRIVTLRSPAVLVEGGKAFPEIRSAELLSFGANVLRFGWIGVGMRMEIHSGNHCVVTSPVRELSIEPHAAATGRLQ